MAIHQICVGVLTWGREVGWVKESRLSHPNGEFVAYCIQCTFWKYLESNNGDHTILQIVVFEHIEGSGFRQNAKQYSCYIVQAGENFST